MGQDTAGKTAERRGRGQGRVFQRPGSAHWWIAYYHRGKEIRESSGSPNEKLARKLLKHRLKEIAADQLGARRFVGPTQERVTVGELLDTLQAHFQLQGKLSAQSLAHLRPIREAFGDRRAVDVIPEMVDHYIQDRLTPRSERDRVIPGKAPATVNRECQLLGQAYRLAMKRGHLNAMPMICRLDTTGNVRQGFFEAADFEAVVKNLPEDLQDFARFGYLSGWRRGEIASLTWATVDRQGKVIRLRPEHSKNRHGRVLVLEGGLWEIIERRWAARQYTTGDDFPALSAYVFHRDGQPIGDFRRAWASACKKAGCEDRLFHDLRRTAVRNMVRAGVPERVAMEVSGHKTRAVFDRYNIVSEEDLREAMRKTQAHVSALPKGGSTEQPEGGPTGKPVVVPMVVVLGSQAAR